MPDARGLRVRATSRLLAKTTARRRFRTYAPQVVLTFDDGPDLEHTPQVMSALAEHDATATFFVLLTRARRSPGLLAELRAAGHEVALHGADHRPLSAFNARETRSRLHDARTELEDLVQAPISHYRPPYGLLTIVAARTVRSEGLRTLLWNRDFQDWIDASEHERLKAATEGVRAGDVLLAHDGHAGESDGAADGIAPDVDRAGLVRAVLGRLQERGLSARSARSFDRRPAGGRGAGRGAGPVSSR